MCIFCMVVLVFVVPSAWYQSTPHTRTRAHTSHSRPKRNLTIVQTHTHAHTLALSPSPPSLSLSLSLVRYVYLSSVDVDMWSNLDESVRTFELCRHGTRRKPRGVGSRKIKWCSYMGVVMPSTQRYWRCAIVWTTALPWRPPTQKPSALPVRRAAQYLVYAPLPSHTTIHVSAYPLPPRHTTESP